MDRDDPETRIAELERQLSEAREAARTDHTVEQPPQFLMRGLLRVGSRSTLRGRAVQRT
jgi:hypothetical protein